MGSNKKVLSKAVSELGKAKAPGKPRDITVDPKGYWNPANQGQPVRIPGGGDPNGMDITMGSNPETGQPVPYPVWAQPNVGPGVAMQQGQDYNFPNASYVDETPMAKKGGTLQSKKYSKSMSATNKLFTKNKLFQNKKSKIFDPNAEFKKGGSKLGTINLNPNPLSHYELNYGFNLPTEEDGGENEDKYMDLTDEEIQAYRDGGYIVEELPEAQVGGPQNTSGPRAEEIPADVNAMNAMMKARMATDAEFGNPAARRMTSPNPKTYDFGNGDLGTHFMASMGNQAVPLLQDKGDDELEYNENPPPSKEDMNFRTPEEAQYFAEHYKEVAPMMRGFKQGGYVQHELVKAQTGKTTYSGPKAGLVGPSTPKNNGSPLLPKQDLIKKYQQEVDKAKAAKIAEAERVKQKAIAKQKAGWQQAMDQSSLKARNSNPDNLGPQSAGSADWFWTLPIAGSAALEAAGSLGAMSLPGMASVPGATLGNAVNAGFIAHGITQTPETIKAWNDVSEGKKSWSDAALETGINLSEFIGSGAGIKSIAQDINQGAKYLNQGTKAIGKKLPGSPNALFSSTEKAGITGNKNLSGVQNVYVPKSTIENPTAKALEDNLEMLSRTGYKLEPMDRSIKGRLTNFIKSSIAPLDEGFVMPLRYNSSIKKAKKYFDEQKEYFKIPEVRAKLIEYRVNPDELQKINFQIGNTGSGSYGNKIQFDPREMKKIQKLGLMLDERTIMAHELGHSLGFNADKTNKVFLPNKTIKDLPINKELYQEVIKNKYEYGSPAHQLEYFTEGINKIIPESYAHLREMKQNMINTGIIKRLDEPVTEKQLTEFFSHNYKTGKDRISSIVDKTDPKLIKFLSKELSNARILVPTIGTGVLGAGALQQEKNGGATESWEDELEDNEIEELRRGGFIVEELK